MKYDKKEVIGKLFIKVNKIAVPKFQTKLQIIIMEQPSLDPNQLKLQIIDSTCLSSQKLNKNNTIDGTNIVYLAGASIVFHNIFQNTKKFIPRLNDSQILGMAFLKSTDNMVALATKSMSLQLSPQNTQNQPTTIARLNIELYALGQKPTLLAQLNENVEFLDMEFYDKKKIILLTREFQECYFYFLQPLTRIKKKQVNMQNPKRFISLDRKISVLGEKGVKDMDLQMQNLNAQLKFARIKIDDYAIIDNEFEIILSGNQLHCYHDYQLSDSKSLSNFKQNLQSEIQPCCFVHVGRNLLIAHKNSITLSHFIIDNGTIRFMNHYTYKDKIKGGIISMEVSFDQMHLAMAVELIEKDTSRVQHFMFNLSILSSEKKFINPFIRLFPLGTETTEITSLQGVIPFQTYYLTGNSIVNYSFNDSVQKKFKFCLHQVPKQLCAHPLGYQFVCIFDNQIKFYIKIQSEIVEVWNEQFICSSAKYMSCGQLLMACLQDNFYQLFLYDTNSFKKIRFIPSIYMKHPVTKIQLIKQDSQVILYCNHDLSIYTLKTGQKTAQYKEKKDKQEILALTYDPQSMILLASTGNKTLTCSKKINEASWEFKYQKVIPIKQDITCIEINTLLETVFMGTKSGKILWTQYPLNLIEKEDLTFSIEYRELKLSQNAVSQIHITNNFKYIFISLKNEGLVICKIKKTIKYQGGMRYNEFEINNMNFLQTSSKNWMQTGQQKLKSLLQKRKTVFNDLDEYKKQWELKKNMKLRMMERENKEKQLQHVNQALGQVQRLKKQKQTCNSQLHGLQQQTTQFVRQKQQKYQKQIILYYNKNIELKVRKQNVTKRCQEQYQSIQTKCKQNINEIENQLKKKYQIFIQNYHEMKHNLTLFEKRFEIEKQQAQEILLQLFTEKRQKLQAQQLSQNQHSNELKALITKYKKELQRYNSRKYFLQQKKNYFLEQLNFCINEKQQLTQIKSELQAQLKELQIFTNKKQKRLRKYFKQNDILTKYQLIHNNLMADLQNQLQFIQQQKNQSSRNIVSIQKELSQVAQSNQKYDFKLQELKKNIDKVRNKTYLTSDKTRYLQHLIEEMSQSLQKLKTSLTDQNKAELFTNIYRQFYIKRKLQNVLQSSNNLDTNEQQEQMQYRIFNSAQNKKKTLQNLEKHKKYLQKNMNLFENHNKKTNQELNLNYLRYQTQNYNLIAQCNIRKEQTSKKKRILHELIDSVKDTQLIINQLQKQNFDEEPKLSRPSSMNKHHRRSTGSIPFIQYKKNKQQIEKSRLKVLRKQESEPSIWKVRQSTYQVRKMLDIQKVSRPESQNKVQRRIKTAMIKNRQTADKTVHLDSDSFIPATNDFENKSKKPMTATGKRHQAPFGQYYTYSAVKNKSASKPTTCTLHTSKNKTSLYQ